MFLFLIFLSSYSQLTTTCRTEAKLTCLGIKAVVKLIRLKHRKSKINHLHQTQQAFVLCTDTVLVRSLPQQPFLGWFEQWETLHRDILAQRDGATSDKNRVQIFAQTRNRDQLAAEINSVAKDIDVKVVQQFHDFFHKLWIRLVAVEQHVHVAVQPVEQDL
uniref:Putative secreted protein n=1 Tax=Anopheles marajoara TaxID=58244 RepID=A0A2M4C660_9DIPT